MRPGDVDPALRRLPALVNADAGLVRRGQALGTTFLVRGRHLPMSEHPARSRTYLLPVLEALRGGRP